MKSSPKGARNINYYLEQRMGLFGLESTEILSYAVGHGCTQGLWGESVKREDFLGNGRFQTKYKGTKRGRNKGTAVKNSPPTIHN